MVVGQEEWTSTGGNLDRQGSKDRRRVIVMWAQCVGGEALGLSGKSLAIGARGIPAEPRLEHAMVADENLGTITPLPFIDIAGKQANSWHELVAHLRGDILGPKI